MQASLPQSQTLDLLGDEAYLAWPHFFLICDDWGIFRLDPKTILSTLFLRRKGLSEERLLSWIQEYAKAELVEVYKDDTGCRWCWLTGWFRNQSKWARSPVDCTDPIPPSWKEDGDPVSGKKLNVGSAEAPKKISIPTRDVQPNDVMRLAEGIAKAKTVRT